MAAKTTVIKPHKNRKLEGVKKGDHWIVPWTMLGIPTHVWAEGEGVVRQNPREEFEFDDIPELAEDILLNEVQEPITAFKVTGGDKFWVTNGERRFRAGEYIFNTYGKVIFYKVILEPRGITMQQRLINMHVKNRGKAMSPLGVAELVRRLRLTKISDAEIAKRLGFQPAYISRLGKLLKAPPELIALIKEGKMSAKEVMDEMVSDGGKEFVEDYKEGKYDEVIAKAPTKAASKQAPITKRTIAAVKQSKVNVVTTQNSWAILKSVINALNPKTVKDPQKTKTMIFIVKVMENKATRSYIENYFK